MKKNKPVFTLTKVIDPYSNMPNKIRSAWLDGNRDDAMNNGSFVNWHVGNSSDWLGYEEKYYNLKMVDNWLLENGFKDGEEVMILYWW